jgi:rhodanese-related sulfurtransferase
MQNSFEGKGLLIKGIIHLSPHEAQLECQKGALLLDIREDYDTDYKKFDVPEIIYCPYRRFGEFNHRVSRDQPLIVAASTSLRSKEIAEILISLGFTNIANLNGGMVDWERDGLPILKDRTAEMHGQCVCRLRRK